MLRGSPRTCTAHQPRGCCCTWAHRHPAARRPRPPDPHTPVLAELRPEGKATGCLEGPPQGPDPLRDSEVTWRTSGDSEGPGQSIPGPGCSVRPTPWTRPAATPHQGDIHTQHPRPAGASQGGLPTAHLRLQLPSAQPQLALQPPALSPLPQRGQDSQPSPPGCHKHGRLVPHPGPGPEPPHRASCRDPDPGPGPEPPHRASCRDPDPGPGPEPPHRASCRDLDAHTHTRTAHGSVGSMGPAPGSHPTGSSPCQQPSLEAP